MELLISLQTVKTNQIGTLRAIEPDADGVYRGIPLAVLGAASRNQVCYDPKTGLEAMENPETAFYKKITGGGLDGEWGHPIIAGLPENAALNRIAAVDDTRVSHFFPKIDIVKSDDGKCLIIKGDVKPYGPYGEFLTKSFADTLHDTAFSLRALTSSPVRQPNNTLLKKVLAMVTYDAVSTPGYEIASKRSIATEGLEILFEDENLQIIPTAELLDTDHAFYDTIGYENINCQQVKDILCSDDVTVTYNSQAIGIFDTATKTFRTNLRKKSLVHNIIEKTGLSL